MSYGAKLGIWFTGLLIISATLFFAGVQLGKTEKTVYIVEPRSQCEKSNVEITATLTVVKRGDEIPYDLKCAGSGTGNYKMYTTKEGIYFDSFKEYSSGDKVEVSGRFYHIDDNRIAISGDLIQDITVRALPPLIITPSPTAIRVKIE